MCFSYGTYGHSIETYLWKKQKEATKVFEQQAQSEASLAVIEDRIVTDMIVNHSHAVAKDMHFVVNEDKVDEGYGPWMLVSRARKEGKTMNIGGVGNTKQLIENNQFAILGEDNIEQQLVQELKEQNVKVDL